MTDKRIDSKQIERTNSILHGFAEELKRQKKYITKGGRGMSKSQDRRLKIQKTQTAREMLIGVIYNEIKEYGCTVVFKSHREKLADTILSEKELIQAIVKERVEVDEQLLEKIILNSWANRYSQINNDWDEAYAEVATKSIAKAQDKILRVK